MAETEPYVTSVDPAAFANSVAGTSDEHLAEGLRGPLRETILDEIFRRMEEHFEPGDDAADAVVRFRIGGRADGEYDRYQVTIRGRECKVSKDTSGHARVTLTIGDVDFLKLATGNANGPELFLKRRIKIKGDLMFAAQVAGLFRIPKPR